MTRLLAAVMSFALALPLLAQNADSAGALKPGEAASGELGQTNPYVITVVVIVLLAIALAYLLRRKPADLGY